ncbi:unnamed protein product [Clonostachys byssicola]|uniref:Enoyl reductase (ER) domain-containing protein n=1 Tax=Clonostachys byssicola TaxID=160290 RepID=A0A9N9UR28_9HYPO|nr:unnamed protein product [Clonostachys byssicola]
MKAVVIRGSKAVLSRSRELPKLREDCLLVRPVAVALNPTDWRHIKGRRAKDDCILGCDYSGVVESVGSGVGHKWKPGDRIFGSAHGANLVNADDGVFAELACVIGDLQMRMPESLTFAQAATIGLGAGTVGQGLYQKGLKLDLPGLEGKKNPRGISVLIYGGGTSTGALGIQYAKLSGYNLITACSPRHFEYVKDLGADFAVDYSDNDAGARIRQYTDNRLIFAWDTISKTDSARTCAEALTSLSSLKPIYSNLLPIKSPRQDVSSTTTVFHTIFGKPFKFGSQEMEAQLEDYEFGKTFYRLTEYLLAKGHLRPHKCRVEQGGLEGVIQGLLDLEAGKIRGEKLVYMVEDTP